MDHSLTEFMGRLGAAAYTSTLQKEDIHLQDLMSIITEADLEKLGLPLGPRRRILNEAQRLRSCAHPLSTTDFV